jgi:hypothetical protein
MPGSRAGKRRAPAERRSRYRHWKRFDPVPCQRARGSRWAPSWRWRTRGWGRTFFLAPVGAGVELTGPGGDGFLSVVTPLSPVGKAVLGRRVGETVEVTVQGEPHEWTITYAM